MTPKRKTRKTENKNFLNFIKKCLQFIQCCGNIAFGLQKRGSYAAIAQQVERILGKDEVTSSNLVSSSAVIGSTADKYVFRGVAQFG